MHEATSWIVETVPGRGDAVIAEYLRLGLPFDAIVRLDNISAFMGRDIYVLWGLTELQNLYIQGVITVEGGVDFIYNALPDILSSLLPPNPSYIIAALLQRLPIQVRELFPDPWLLQALPNLYPPVTENLAKERPFGARGLQLGQPVDEATAALTGDLDSILALIGAPGAWQENQGDDAVIAIVDTGVDGSRIPITNRAGGWTNIPNGDPWSDEVGHGSMVARIALAVAPRARIFSIKPATDVKGVISSSSIYMGLDYLLGWTLSQDPRPAVIVNNSWGVYGCLGIFLPADILGVRFGTKMDAINLALVTFAAGNWREECGDDAISLYDIGTMAPSLAVGAVDRNLRPQFYSSKGPGSLFPFQPACVCPTWGVLPWGASQMDMKEQGGATSSCAPQVAGALAILKTAYPQATNREIRTAVRMGANNAAVGRPGVFYDPLTGSGLLNIPRALRAMQSPRLRIHPSYILEGTPFVRPISL